MSIDRSVAPVDRTAGVAPAAPAQPPARTAAPGFDLSLIHISEPTRPY